jgi:ribosome recycling factor
LSNIIKLKRGKSKKVNQALTANNVNVNPAKDGSVILSVHQMNEQIQ